MNRRFHLLDYPMIANWTALEALEENGNGYEQWRLDYYVAIEGNGCIKLVFENDWMDCMEFVDSLK